MYFPFPISRLGETAVKCPVGTLCGPGYYMIERGITTLVHVTLTDGKIMAKYLYASAWTPVTTIEHDGKIVGRFSSPVYYYDGVFTIEKPLQPMKCLENGIFVFDTEKLAGEIRNTIASLKKLVDMT